MVDKSKKQRPELGVHFKEEIAVLSTNRADWAYLKRLIDALEDSDKVFPSIICAGVGENHRGNLEDMQLEGYSPSAIISSAPGNDSRVEACYSSGILLGKMGEVLETMKPSILVVLGDRYETLSAVSAANILGIPVAHLHGGESTRGAFDNSFRWAISKMSDLHFVSCSVYGYRLLSAGVNHRNIYVVGSLSSDNIVKSYEEGLYTRRQLSKKLGSRLQPPICVLTYRPETNLPLFDEMKQLDAIYSALSGFGTVVSIGGSPDPGSEAIEETIDGPFIYVNNLSNKTYLSLLNTADVMVGNSSSGIYETCYLNLPTVNVGSRQSGRLKPGNVITCGLNYVDKAVKEAMSRQFKMRAIKAVRPWGNGVTAESIRSVLEALDFENLGARHLDNRMTKRFERNWNKRVEKGFGLT